MIICYKPYFGVLAAYPGHEVIGRAAFQAGEQWGLFKGIVEGWRLPATGGELKAVQCTHSFKGESLFFSAAVKLWNRKAAQKSQGQEQEGGTEVPETWKASQAGYNICSYPLQHLNCGLKSEPTFQSVCGDAV